MGTSSHEFSYLDSQFTSQCLCFKASNSQEDRYLGQSQSAKTDRFIVAQEVKAFKNLLVLEFCHHPLLSQDPGMYLSQEFVVFLVAF